MLIALAFAHFSSELLLKEQMITPVKKTLNNAGHINAKLIDFSEICQKNSAKSAVFYWLFLGEVSPRNILWNWTIFLRTCPWKSFKIWLFSAKIPLNRPIFLRILTFSRKYPAKSADFSANFDFFPAKSADFSWNLPLKIPGNFAFFSAKYQKPCVLNRDVSPEDLKNTKRLLVSAPSLHFKFKKIINDN